MACLEHYCFDCKWMDASNGLVDSCPKCGSGNVQSTFDEPPEHDDPRDFDEEEDDDDE